jgi:trehalose-6-phosphatase
VLQPRLGLVAENGFYTRPAGSDTWATKEAHNDSWKKIVLPILQQYQVRHCQRHITVHLWKERGCCNTLC